MKFHANCEYYQHLAEQDPTHQLQFIHSQLTSPSNTLAQPLRHLFFQSTDNDNDNDNDHRNSKQSFFWRIVTGHWEGELTGFQKKAKARLEGQEGMEIREEDDGDDEKEIASEIGSVFSCFSGK